MSLPMRTRRRLRATALSGALCTALLAGAAVLTDGGDQLPAALAVQRADVFADTGPRPADGPGLNFLLVGIDERAGLTKEEKRRLHVGGEPCRCTDVMMLVHISADRERVSVVSIPRDSYVRFAHPRGAKSAGAPLPEAGKINGAYKLGGPSLTVRTVEQATGVRIDHYLEADFASFVTAVDELGGATVCATEPLRDVNSGLDIPEGTVHLDGRGALQYVRARKIPPSGDLGRMRRQQRFLAELADSFADRGVLRDPVALARTAGTLLRTLRADEDLTFGRLTLLGRSLSRLDSSRTEFATVPLADFDHRVPGWGSTLVWDEARARKLFAALREDRPINREDAYSLPGPGVPVAWAPSDVRVRVRTSARLADRAEDVQDGLRGSGFDVRGGVITDAAETDGTEIIHPPSEHRRATALAAALPDARLRSAPGHSTVLEVRVGRYGHRVVPVVHDRSSVQGAPATGEELDCDGNG